MPRTHRLFELLQMLRRRRQPVSGAELAREAGTSLRTLYRDIAALQAMGAEIDGEPGVGCASPRISAAALDVLRR
jgi:predicted DNA-binding transcriptional regulator YafY